MPFPSQNLLCGLVCSSIRVSTDTVGSLLSLGCCEYCFCERGCADLSSRPCFSLCLYTQKWNHGSYSDSVFNYLKNCHMVFYTVLCFSYSVRRSQDMWGLQENRREGCAGVSYQCFPAVGAITDVAQTQRSCPAESGSETPRWPVPGAVTQPGRSSPQSPWLPTLAPPIPKAGAVTWLSPLAGFET